jgi:hypothetical protein
MTTNLETVWQFDLRRGNSTNPREGACLLDAISWFEYGKLGDHPPCVSPVYAAYGRIMNDMFPDDKRQLLKRFLTRLPGTVDPDSERARVEYMVKRSVREILPISRRLVGKIDESILCETLPIDASMKVYKDIIDVIYAASAKGASAITVDAVDAAVTSAAYATIYATIHAMIYADSNTERASACAGNIAYSAVNAARYVAPKDTVALKDAAAIYDFTLNIFEGSLSIGKQADPNLPRWEAANMSFKRVTESV